jgi:hypothetical protein
MPMPRRARALLLLTIFGVAPVGGGAQAALFARHATTLADIYGSSRPMTVTAPDDRTRAIARFTNWRHRPADDHLTVFLGGDDHHFAGGPKAELLWAPDSRALAVTADDGATPSAFDLSILVRRKKGRHWRQIDLTRRVARLFAPEMRCPDADETPNVGAVGWTSGQRLIVAAEVPPHIGCANGGHVEAYVVDVPTGEVLMRLEPRTLRRRYRAMLGTVFAGEGRHRRHRRRG